MTSPSVLPGMIRGTPLPDIAGLLSGGGAPAPTLATLSDRIVFAGNSYEAQSGNIDVASWAMLACGWRPKQHTGQRQARGGDRLTHLHDRAAPLVSSRAAVVVVMNIENDTADALITNNAAGGNLLIGRRDAVLGDVRAAYAPKKIIVSNQPNTNGYISKSVAGAAYNASVPVGSDVEVFDSRAAFNPQDAAQGSDFTHPNKRRGARNYGFALGARIAANFVSDGIFDGGDSLPGNLIAWNPATAWAITNGSGFGTVNQAAGLCADGVTPAHVFTIAGTCTADETLGTTAPDIRLRATQAITPVRSTHGMSLETLFWIEITDSAGNAPVGLATIQWGNNILSTFSKIYVAGDDYWTEKHIGPAGVFPANLNGQTANITFDIILRGRNGVVGDIVVKVARVNHRSTEDVAYGPPANLGAIYTTGRPVIRLAPSTTPAAGPLAVGGTLAANVPPYFNGGGLTITHDVVRDGVIDALTAAYVSGADVGDIVPVTQGSAAVPYTIVAGDSTHTIGDRVTGTSALGSATHMTPQIAVT